MVLVLWNDSLACDANDVGQRRTMSLAMWREAGMSVPISLPDVPMSVAMSIRRGIATTSKRRPATTSLPTSQPRVPMSLAMRSPRAPHQHTIANIGTDIARPRTDILSDVCQIARPRTHTGSDIGRHATDVGTDVPNAHMTRDRHW